MPYFFIFFALSLHLLDYLGITYHQASLFSSSPRPPPPVSLMAIYIRHANRYYQGKMTDYDMKDHKLQINHDNICMQSADQNDYFCYLTINNPASFITNCVTSSFSVFVAVYFCYKFCSMRGSHNRQTTFVYFNMLLWWLTFVGSQIFSLWLYEESKDGVYQDEEMSHMSRYYFVVDWVNGYFIQLLLLFVPYHWCKGICRLFNVEINHNASMLRNSEIFNTRTYEGVETKVFPFLKIYIIFRLSWLALPVLFLVVPQSSQLLFHIAIGCLLFDCIVITFSLLLGMVSLKTSRELIQLLDQQQIKRMFNQYMIIILANTIRFVLDILVFVSCLKNNFGFNTQCPPDYEQTTYVGDVIKTVLIILLAHYFPIFMISRIYTLEERPEEICKSLIITTNPTNGGSQLVASQ